MKILHTADWHVRDKDIEECRKVLQHMVRYATGTRLDLIIIAGDLTDRNDVKFDSQTARLIIETVIGLSRAAPIAICTGTRLHDGNIPELLRDVKGYQPVYVASQPEQLIFTGKDFGAIRGEYDDDEAEAVISFLPTPTKQYLQSQDSIEATDQQVGELMSFIFASFGANADNPNLPHILIGHWQVGGSFVSETQQLTGRDIEISTDQIMSASPDLVCLGHIHMAQQIRNYPIFYSGSTYRKDYGEMESKGFYVHEFNEFGLLNSEWHELPSRKLLRVSHDYTGDKSLDYGLEPLAGKYTDEDVKGSHIRVEFRVWQDQRDRIDKPRLEKILLDKGAVEADVRVISVPRQNVRAGRVLQVERLRDKINARAEIVEDEVPESVLRKCDMIEAENRETVIKKVKEAVA